MKKKYMKILTFVFIMTILLIPCKAFASTTWVPDAAGAGYNGSGHGGACLGDSNCFCNWNNGNYAAAYVEIRYYDGKGTYQQITSRKVVGNGSTSWISSHIDRNFIYWNKFPTQLNGTFASSLNSILMNSGGDYANMKELFSILGANYNDILNKVKTGTYVNGLLGSAKGIRVVVTPIFSIQQIYDATNIRCVSKDYQNRLVTYLRNLGFLGINRSNLQTFMNNPVKYQSAGMPNEMVEGIHDAIAKEVSGDGGYYVYTGTLAELSANDIGSSLNQNGKYEFTRTGSPTQVLRPSQYRTFAKVLYTPARDIFSGHASADEANSIDTSRQISETTGWGVGIYLPFDHLDPNFVPEVPVETPAQPEEPNGCKYEIRTSVPSTCDSDETSGYVKDIDDWNCIFKSKTALDNNVKKHYIENGDNKYCNIYCREEVVLNYPGNNISVDQGKYLSIGDKGNSVMTKISPVNYKGTKTCMASSDRLLGQIDYQTFNEDLQAANKNVQVAWNIYQTAIANRKAVDNASGGRIYNSSECKTEVEKEKMEKDCYALSQKKSEREQCEKTNKKIKYKECVAWYQMQTWSGSANNGIYHGSVSWENKIEGSNQGPDKNAKAREYDNAVNSAKSNYNAAVSARNNLINRFASCTGVLPNITYTTFKPELDFTYVEPVYGNTWTLVPTLTDESKDSTFWLENGSQVKFGNTNLFKSFIVYKCDNQGNGCNTGNKQSILYARTWASTITKQYTYTLPTDTYRYAEKGSGQSVNGSNCLPSKQYIDIGYSTLPIHYSTNPGVYDYSLDTTTYGNNNKFNSFALLGTLFSGKSYKVDDDYSCDYEVACTNRITCNGSNSCDNYDACDNKNNDNAFGVNVIYRTISLYSKKEAFPGFKGEGRKPGANWDSENDYTVNTFIVNNRGVKDYEVYHLQPMYEISLTPKTMKLLRKYNKYMNSKVIDMYAGTSVATSGIAGYSDFENMTCSNGRNCKSGLIRGKVASYQLNVTGCAISSSGSYTNCGNTKAW